jgi:hypothetical protein
MVNWQQVGRYGLYVVGGLLAFLVAVLLVLQIPSVKRAILDEITSEANRQMAGEMSAEGLGGPVLWRVTLDDVQIRDSRGTPVAHIDSMRVSYSFLKLIGGELDIERVGMRRPLVLVRRYADGSMNVLKVAQPGPPSEERFELSDIVVREGTLVYDDRSAGLAAGEESSPSRLQREVSLWIEQVFSAGEAFETSTVQEEFEASGAGTADADGGEGTLEVVLVDGMDVEANLIALPDGAIETTIDDFELRVHAHSLDSPLGLAGEDVKLASETDRYAGEIEEMTFAESAEVESLNVSMVPASGSKTGSGSEQGPAFDEIAAQVESMQVTPELAEVVAGTSALGIPFTVEGELEGSPETTRLQAVAEASDAGRVAVEGSVNTTVPRYDISLDLTDFHFDKWAAARLPGISFDATGGVTGRGLSWNEELRAESQLTGSNIEFAGWGANEFRLDARARGRRLELRNLAIEAAHVIARAEGHLSSEGDAIGSLLMRTTGREGARQIADGLDIDPKLLGRAEAELALSEGMGFGVGLQAIPTIAPQLPFSLTAAGEYGEQLENYTVQTMDLGRPGWTWGLQEPGRIVMTDDERLEVSSMSLRSSGQVVSLDGTYSLKRGKLLSEIVERFDGSNLEKLFDLETLRRRFPRMVLDEPVEDLRERVPEEVKPSVPGDLRRELDEFLNPPDN